MQNTLQELMVLEAAPPLKTFLQRKRSAGNKSSQKKLLAELFQKPPLKSLIIRGG